MHATEKKCINGLALLCLLIMLLPTACIKKTGNSGSYTLSPEEVNNLTIDSGLGRAAHKSIAARSAAALRIEAENYSSMYGVQVEDCREGGRNAGYISIGDWMDYEIKVPADGRYDIAFRIAGPGGTLQVMHPGGAILATVNLPRTAGGQIYNTTTAGISLNAGTQTIRIHAVTGYWNFNWFELSGPENESPDNQNTSTGENSTGQNLILNAAFENEIEFKNWVKESCRSGSITINKGFSRKGNASVRFELTKNDVIDYNGFSRAEIRRNCETDNERWYGFSNFLPGDFVSDPLAEKIAQWHDVPDFFLGESWRSPPISFGIVNDRYYVQILWATSPINLELTRSGEKRVDLGPVDKNRWNDWVFHIKFSYKSDGIVEIWKNKVKVLTYYGPNSYNDINYPYFKIGVYKWGWNGWAAYSPEDKRILYYDEVKIGNENSNFNEVSPD